MPEKPTEKPPKPRSDERRPPDAAVHASPLASSERLGAIFAWFGEQSAESGFQLHLERCVSDGRRSSDGFSRHRITNRCCRTQCSRHLPAIFPPYEQIPISYFWRYLQNPETDSNARFHFYCLKIGDEIAGFAFFEIGDDIPGLGKPGYLWYLGIRKDLRGRQYGTKLYQFIQRFVADYGCRALTFEIEIEEEVRGRIGEEEAANAALRRIWYRHLGAKAIGGIHYQYEQGGIWEVMVHTFDEISAQDALDLVIGTIDGKYRIIGEITLT